MFAFPEAKRVRRKDLYDSASDSGSAESDEDKGSHNSQFDSELRAKVDAQLSGLFGLSSAAEHEDDPPTPANNARQSDEQAEEVFAFRLFRDEALTHTIVLSHDDDPAAVGDGGFVVPSRPQSYYIAGATSPEKESEYRSVAVSAEYLLMDAGRRRWGLEKPWRVIHIDPDCDSASSGLNLHQAQAVEEPGGTKKKRTRPGKKRRILLRVREKAVREREEAAQKQALEKEQHVQEKKKRLNRERKLKRRQKEREKKAEARAENPDGPTVDVDNNAESGDES
ncbi:hypothetical protein F4777DRAFT_566181 [Nemania sp. FL0916]|nr:hypothetical protein F4777DRAFT_566181 [Nemania sp. FL0916]